MGYQNIGLIKEGKIGIIKISRHEVLNALDVNTVKEILNALDCLEMDSDIGVIIFIGEGKKAFAAGADINQVAEWKPIDVFAKGGISEVFRRIENSKKATIAAVNGFALGGGSELALACDIRVASENAKFGLPELNLALIPAAGGTQRLARIIGKGRAMNMILTGEMIPASEAKEIGLVSDVVPLENLWDAVQQKAEKILAKGPIAVHMAKLAVNRGFDLDMDTGLLIENLAQAVLYGTNDKEEGTKAFLQKRQASFQGS